jgi:hypothetical protein
MDPRAGLDDMKKKKFLTLQGLEFRPFSRPARSYTDYTMRTFLNFWKLWYTHCTI